MKREILTRKELEAYLGVTPRTLARMRLLPRFPQPFSLTGTTRGLLRWYKDEVDAWANNQTQRVA